MLYIWLAVYLLLPYLTLSLVCLQSLFLWSYERLHAAKARLARTDAEKRQFWAYPLRCISHVICAYGRLMHGYETVDLDRLPAEGPGLLIFYHGTTPLDILLFICKMILRGRKPILIADRFIWYIPGFMVSMRAFECTTGSRESLTALLRDGNLVAIYPGGAREAFYSTDAYDLLWQDRTGFARVAIEARVPIFPCFTSNTRQIHWQVNTGKDACRRYYDRTRIPLIFAFGYFPVKLRTFIGAPIEFEQSRSVEDLIALTKSSLEALIAQKQRRPGNILVAMSERVWPRQELKKLY